MATMDDLIATLSGGMIVGQNGHDLKQLQAHLNQTLFQPHHIHHMAPAGAHPPSRSTSCSRQQYIASGGHSGEPLAPPSSYTNSFAPSSFPSFPSPMIGTESSSAMVTPKARPVLYGRTASYGFPIATTSLPASPNANAMPHHSVLPPPEHCDDMTGSAFGDDAFAPLCQQQDRKTSWGAFQDPPVARNPWAAFGARPTESSSVSAVSSAVDVRRVQEDDDMEMDDEEEDEDCVEQEMGGNWRTAPQPIQKREQAVGGWEYRGRY